MMECHDSVSMDSMSVSKTTTTAAATAMTTHVLVEMLR
jgi:hypothetical protein